MQIDIEYIPARPLRKGNREMGFRQSKNQQLQFCFMEK